MEAREASRWRKSRGQKASLIKQQHLKFRHVLEDRSFSWCGFLGDLLGSRTQSNAIHHSLCLQVGEYTVGAKKARSTAAVFWQTTSNTLHGKQTWAGIREPIF